MHRAADIKIFIPHSLVERLVVYIHGTAASKATQRNLNERRSTKGRDEKYVRTKLDLSPAVRHGASNDDGRDQAHLFEDGVDHRLKENCRAIDIANPGRVNKRPRKKRRKTGKTGNA